MAAVDRFHLWCESENVEQSGDKTRTAQLQKLLFAVQAELAGVIFSGLVEAKAKPVLRTFWMEHGYAVAGGQLLQRIDVVKRLARADKVELTAIPEDVFQGYWGIACKLHPTEGV